MTPVERLQAAIEKLETLKDESTAAPWFMESIPETGESRVIRAFEFFGNQIEEVAPGGMSVEDAELIVTLHRTIDAQLAILDTALWHIAQDARNVSMAAVAKSITLADAILGGDS